MKVGIRKPNIKKSVKARTTGKIKRSIKKSVNPLYGKKGMGYVNDPKKAIYNKVYNKTTVGVNDIAQAFESTSGSETVELPYSKRTYKICGIILTILSIITILFGLICFPFGGIIFIIGGIIFLFFGLSYCKLSK